MLKIQIIETTKEMVLIAGLRLVLALTTFIGKTLDLGEGERRAVLARMAIALRVDPQTNP